jgi:hypothetical protein
MTDDVRDRILGLLHGGPATVAGLSARLELPGGVVSYHLKMLEQGGLVRVGSSRIERGVPVARYVSTAAAAAPPLRIPAALPGLTWTGTGRFPVPVWTVDAAMTPAPQEAEGASGSADAAEPGSEPAGGPNTAATPPGSGPAAVSPAGHAGRAAGSGAIAPAQRTSPDERPAPAQARSAAPAIRSQGGPRLAEVRRIAMDDATFYEFASRLDALAKEFAGRATADAPAAELAIALYRPPGEAADGNGS